MTTDPEQHRADRVEKKRNYLLYRRIAQEIAPLVHVGVGASIRVEGRAAVQICEDGAFVEAEIFIPKEHLAEVLEAARRIDVAVPAGGTDQTGAEETRPDDVPPSEGAIPEDDNDIPF